MPLNTREEQEFKKLHLNLNKRMPRLWLSITVERNGIILEDRREEGHSWTRNAWWLMNGVMLDCVSDGGTEAYNRFGVTTSGSVTASSYPPVRDVSFAGVIHLVFRSVQAPVPFMRTDMSLRTWLLMVMMLTSFTIRLSQRRLRRMIQSPGNTHRPLHGYSITIPGTP
ncbi:MAG: hypothetical protein AVO39_10395 [delta proteobacterium MLS_D]|nr:MAG: hypothetical protein AVO39_10395 [delta proteobacterium MLS_D]